MAVVWEMGATVDDGTARGERKPDFYDYQQVDLLWPRVLRVSPLLIRSYERAVEVGFVERVPESEPDEYGNVLYRTTAYGRAARRLFDKKNLGLRFPTSEELDALRPHNGGC